MNTTAVSEAQLLQLTERVSSSLLSNHPVSSDQVTGEEIKSYFPHNQINSFLLFQIYQVWDQRVQQLKHPYFDFSSDEVTEVLDNLKNRLAHHIAVDSESFKSLVDRAVANTLGFILEPKNGFKEFFFPQDQPLSIDQLGQYAHFFSDWDFVVNSILKYCRKHEKSAVTWDEFSDKMERVMQIYEQKKGQTILDYRKGLYHSLTGEDLQAYLDQLEAARLAEEQEAQAKAEAARVEEARRRAEEEQARLEAERLAKEEEERQRKEAEAKKKTIFDDLGGGETLDLDDDLDTPVDSGEEAVAETVVEVEEPVTEETGEEVAAVEEHQEVVEETVEEETPEHVEAVEEVAEETQEEAEKEFLEMAASMEPTPEPEPAPVPEEPKTTFDKLTNGATTFLDRFQSKKEEQEETVSEVLEEVTETVEEVAETPPAPEVPVEPVFGAAPSEEDSSSVLDKIQEKSQTVADKFAEQTRQRKLHESINGNQKIKLDEIPIHKQYQYVQKVFGGNNVRFRIIVDRVNDARDANEVEDILNKFVLSIDDLDREDPVVQEFVQLLRNRF